MCVDLVYLKSIVFCVFADTPFSERIPLKKRTVTCGPGRIGQFDRRTYTCDDIRLVTHTHTVTHTYDHIIHMHTFDIYINAQSHMEKLR